MSDVQTVVLAIEKRAKDAGIKLSMRKLRDAIAIALWGRRYAVAIEAEKHGELAVEEILVPIYGVEACKLFRLRPGALDVLFGQSYFGSTMQPDSSDDGLYFDLRRLGGHVPLHVRVDKQHLPRRAFVSLSNDGRVGVGVEDAPGAFGPEMWNSQTIRWYVSPMIDGTALALLLQRDRRPLLGAVHRGHQPKSGEQDQDWVLTEDAERARQALEKALEEVKRHDVRWPSEFLFGAHGVPPSWGDNVTLHDHALEMWSRAIKSDDVHLLLGENVEECLAEAALAILATEPERLSRAVVRDLAKRSKIALRDYAEWIAAHGDGIDVQETCKDGEIEAFLEIRDSGASDAECLVGSNAGEELLAARGVTEAQAYIAEFLRANGASFISAHFEAWEASKLEAFKCAFDGWAKWPERAVLTAVT